jgi:hypothetical protein
VIQKKRPGKLSKNIILLLHGNAWPHTANFDIGKNGLGNYEPPLVSPQCPSFVWTNEDAPRRTKISN